ETERPFLTRAVRVPDRVVHHVLGDETCDPTVADLLVDQPPRVIAGDDVARAIAAGARLIYLRERPGSAGRACAATALEAQGIEPLILDLERLDGDAVVLAALAVREAQLLGAGLVVGPLEVLVARNAAAIRAFAEAACPIVLL